MRHSCTNNILPISACIVEEHTERGLEFDASGCLSALGAAIIGAAANAESGEPDPADTLRRRSLFPLPLLDELPDAVGCKDEVRRRHLLVYVNGLLVGLNLLYGCSRIERRRPTRLQRRVQQDCALKADRFLDRLSGAAWTALPDAALRRIIKETPPGKEDEHRRKSALKPDRIAHLETAGRVNPQCKLEPGTCQLLTREHIFASPPEGLNRFAGQDKRDYSDYVQLVVRGLRGGKLELRTTVEAIKK